MLTCDICGEELMLEEDMETHLLLSHLESVVHCPLCSLSGVSYDELCFHISSAHPETQRRAAPLTSTPGCSAAGAAHQVLPQPLAGDGWDAAALASGSSVTTGSVQCKLNITAGSTKTRQESLRHCDEGKSEHTKAKCKRLSSPGEEKRFSCPMCALVCSSCLILQEHVELHLQEQLSAEGEKRLECPLCSVLCSDSFCLQEHVELHLEPGAAVTSAESLGSDLRLAQQLQQEEEQRRRQQEAQQEKEEFNKLQKQFGLDGRGSYRRQMERAMEKAVSRGLMGPAEFHCQRAELMESLASGLDDGKTRTPGVLQALHEFYQTEGQDRVHVWLSANTDHYCSSAGDRGWGCGYRNIQMLLSSLHSIDVYASLFQEKTVPSIPQLQSMIEGAWKEGLDPQGSSHFNQRLQGSRAWIGATEIFSLLTSLGISARIIDFHRPTGPGHTHPQLFDWVKQYFCQFNRSSKPPPRLIHTSLPPLYLQHQGHSRSIVGLEQKKNGSLCLLLLDPSSSVSDTRKLLSRGTVSTSIRHVRQSPGSMKHKQYQVVVVQGVLSAEEKQISIMNSRTLCAERIP